MKTVQAHNAQFLGVYEKHENDKAISPPRSVTKQDILNYLRTLTDEKRLEIFHEFCTICGGTKRPCYCSQDE